MFTPSCVSPLHVEVLSDLMTTRHNALWSQVLMFPEEPSGGTSKNLFHVPVRDQRLHYNNKGAVGFATLPVFISQENRK